MYGTAQNDIFINKDTKPLIFRQTSRGSKLDKITVPLHKLQTMNNI